MKRKRLLNPIFVWLAMFVLNAGVSYAFNEYCEYRPTVSKTIDVGEVIILTPSTIDSYTSWYYSNINSDRDIFWESDDWDGIQKIDDYDPGSTSNKYLKRYSTKIKIMGRKPGTYSVTNYAYVKSRTQTYSGPTEYSYIKCTYYITVQETSKSQLTLTFSDTTKRVMSGTTIRLIPSISDADVYVLDAIHNNSYGHGTRYNISNNKSVTISGVGNYELEAFASKLYYPTSDVVSFKYQVLQRGDFNVTMPNGADLHFNIISDNEQEKTCRLHYVPQWLEGDFTIPNKMNGYTVVEIEDEALYECSKLTSVMIPETVKSIGKEAFYGCKGLTSITLPNSLISIEYQAFKGCKGLTSITIPETVETIGQDAFDGCDGLKSIIIPGSVKSFGLGAFSDCSELNSIRFLDGVEYIGQSICFNCEKLETIELPSSIKEIEWSAFRNCPNLKFVTSLIKEPFPIETTVFMNTNDSPSTDAERAKYWTSATLYVPKGCKEKYQSTAGWLLFKDIREIELVESITLSPKTVKLFVGKEKKVSATILPENAANRKVKWSSDNEDVASVNWDGLVTAREAGQAVITCTAEDGSGVSASCVVTVVQEVKVDSIALDEQAITLSVGANKQLTAKAFPENATKKKVGWSSDNEEVATVDSYGLVVAKSVGQAIITCTAEDGSGVSASCVVTVEEKTMGIVGDVNGDGTVNGTDLVALANIILGKQAETDAADVNGDRQVNGTDIVALCNIILGRASAPKKVARKAEADGKACLSISEGFDIKAGETKDMVIDLTNPNDELTLVQFDLHLPKGLSVKKTGGDLVIDMCERTNWRKHTLDANEVDGAYRFLLYSSSNALISGNSGGIITVTLTADNTFEGGMIVIDNALLVTPEQQEIKPEKYEYSIGDVTPPTPPTPDTASLSIESFSIQAGETKDMVIDLTNPNDELTLVQFDLHLPKGLSVKKTGGDLVIDMCDRTNWRKHTLDANEVDGAYRFLLYSSSNALISGNSGGIITVTLTADNTFEGGTIVIDNALLVTPEQQEIKPKKYEYSIGDVTPPTPPTPDTASLSIESFSIQAGGDGTMVIDLTNPNDELTLVQFDLHLPKGLSVKKTGGDLAIDMCDRTNWRKHTLDANEVDGAYRFLLYSSSNALISGNSGGIITVTLTADNTFEGGSIVIDNALLVTPEQQEIKPEKYEKRIEPSGNGVEEYVVEKATSRIYNLNGQQLREPQKGINIVDGKKVLVK